MKARKEAYELLKKIRIEKEYANLTLRGKLSNFSKVDRSLITNIVYGTLQNYRIVRQQWLRFVSNELEEEIAILLDLSVYQLLFMDKVPSYAVIDEAVEISKRIVFGKYTKLVNAVLKKVSVSEPLRLDRKSVV